MTSDAKIGLLLGLVFIFVIAFIINGLPSLSQASGNNELTTNMASSRDDSVGLADRERRVQKRIIAVKPKKAEVSAAIGQAGAEKQVRFSMELPEQKGESGQGQRNIEITGTLTPALRVKSQAGLAASGSVWPRTYGVADGDDLAVIAKRFYGSEEGNKRKTIARIFEVNRGLLKSEDAIYVGQRLTIPSPVGSESQSKGVAKVFSSTLFEKVESIGKRQTSDSKSKQNRSYVVREGDSLWKIAAEKLGNGNRFSEIMAMNTARLSDEDSLVIGLRLKLPAL